jgi:hypothetical protein
VWGLVGRKHDCAAIDRLLEDALGGDGGSLMVRREAGIGARAALINLRRPRIHNWLICARYGADRCDYHAHTRQGSGPPRGVVGIRANVYAAAFVDHEWKC